MNEKLLWRRCSPISKAAIYQTKYRESCQKTKDDIRNGYSIEQIRKYKRSKSTSTGIEFHILRSLVGVCSASVLTRHRPSHDMGRLEHCEHSPDNRWGGFGRHNDSEMSKSDFTNSNECWEERIQEKVYLVRAWISLTWPDALRGLRRLK